MELQPTPVNKPDQNQAALAQMKLVLMARARSGTDWFFWIAGLSLVNTIINLVGGSLSFVTGLGIMQLIDGLTIGFAKNAEGSTGFVIHLIGFAVNLLIALIFVMAGFLSRQRYRWVVIAGMLIYLLDALVFIVFQDWVPLLFHGWALWGLWNGLQAINALKKLEESDQTIGIHPSF